MRYPITMSDHSEVIDYNEVNIPLYIRIGKLSYIDDMRFLAHWHDDFEFILVLQGRTRFYINRNEVVLEVGDCLMVNSRQMHYNEAINHQDAETLCILAHPSLFAGSQAFYRNYVAPIVSSSGLEFMHWRSAETETAEIAKLLSDISNVKETITNYSISAIGYLYLLWQKIYDSAVEHLTDISFNTDLNIQRNMISYIYQNFMHRITLADIAAAGNVCRSKCCQMFQEYLHQSPIDFVNDYRLSVSCNLLKQTKESITQIAYDCGFPHSSYFGKLFLRKYHCTPREYRRRQSSST